jgi:hypothetical protein
MSNEKLNLFADSLMKQDPRVARMNEVYIEEIDAIAKEVGGRDKVTWDDLELASQRATERLAKEQQEGKL